MSVRNLQFPFAPVKKIASESARSGQFSEVSEKTVGQYVGAGGSDTIRGLLHSPALTTIETLRLDEDSETLQVTTELKDTAFFTYIRTDLQVTPGCVPEVLE